MAHRGAEPASHLLFSQVIASRQATTTRKCLGIAKNYFTNALKNDPSKVTLPQYPYIFSKSLSCILPRGENFHLPKSSAPNTINYEVELGVMLSRGGARGAGWQQAIGGYFLLIDFTDTSLLKPGNPWYLSKAQDGFLALSEFIPAEIIADPHKVELELRLNDKTR